MKKVVVLTVVLLSVTWNALGEDTIKEQFQSMQDVSEKDDRELLNMFTPEEQYIILAFRHQLELTSLFYNLKYKTLLDTPIQIKFFDLVSLFNDYKSKNNIINLDGFLDYILGGIIDKDTPEQKYAIQDKLANISINIEAFKNKVRMDYDFIKKHEAEKENEKDFYKILYNALKPYKNRPELHYFLQGLEERIR